jgi:hypothetical protein
VPCLQRGSARRRVPRLLSGRAHSVPFKTRREDGAAMLVKLIARSRRRKKLRREAVLRNQLWRPGSRGVNENGMKSCGLYRFDSSSRRIQRIFRSCLRSGLPLLSRIHPRLLDQIVHPRTTTQRLRPSPHSSDHHQRKTDPILHRKSLYLSVRRRRKFSRRTRVPAMLLLEHLASLLQPPLQRERVNVQ